MIPMKWSKSTLRTTSQKFAVPNHSLRVQACIPETGDSKTIEFKVLNKAMDIVDDVGNRYIDSDSFTIFAGISQPDRRSVELTSMKPLSVDISL